MSSLPLHTVFCSQQGTYALQATSIRAHGGKGLAKLRSVRQAEAAATDLATLHATFPAPICGCISRAAHQLVLAHIQQDTSLGNVGCDGERPGNHGFSGNDAGSLLEVVVKAAGQKGSEDDGVATGLQYEVCVGLSEFVVSSILRLTSW
jgi:hypothetical protein